MYLSSVSLQRAVLTEIMTTNDTNMLTDYKQGEDQEPNLGGHFELGKQEGICTSLQKEDTVFQ